MHDLLKKILRALAVRVVARYHPKVIAAAGSVGKTSTRNAIVAALGKASRVRGGEKNFNNEIGVPLVILGEGKTGGKNPLAWFGIFLRGAWLAWGPKGSDYPRILVLEMAVDHQGDIAYLAGIAKPDVAVVTAVAEEHTEFLGDLDGVAKEEGMIVEMLDASGTAVLNADDPRVLAMRSRTKAKIITYGIHAPSDVHAEALTTEFAMGSFFTRFDLVAKGMRIPVTLTGCIGEGNVAAALAGAASAIAVGVEPSVIPYGLAEYQPPPGRLRPITGARGSLLIDDTYNSSPRAAELALRTLMALPSSGGRRIAVMADMLELGTLAEGAHRAVGMLAASLGVNLLIGVGPLSALMCEEAKKEGLSAAEIKHFTDAKATAAFLKEAVGAGDIVLIKGSRGMRMEHVTEALTKTAF